MSLFRKSKESPEQAPGATAEQQSTAGEGKAESSQLVKLELSKEEKEQINQRTAEIEQRIEEIKAIRTNEDTWNKLDDDKAQALFDEYTKIKNEKEKLQRKLEGKEEDEFWDKEAGIIRNVRFKMVVDKQAVGRPRPSHGRLIRPTKETRSYISRHAGRPLVVLMGHPHPLGEIDLSMAYNVRVVNERPNKISVAIIE